MASYNELKALIDAYIYPNGVQAITGQILNGVLKAIVDQVGAGYNLMGVAHPSDDPGTPDAPSTWFAYEAGTYADFGGVTVTAGELAIISSDGLSWTKQTIFPGIQSVAASVDDQTGTPSVTPSYDPTTGALSFAFHNMKGAPGDDGDAAGFGTIGATVDDTEGTPAVSVQESGPNTAKNLSFQFTGLKGKTGVTSVLVTVDDTVGTPSCAVSLSGQVLSLAFTGLKGAQGDTGSSVDYPFTIVNNLTTNDPTQALSAAMGYQLEGEITQLEHEVHNLSGKFYGVFADDSALPEGDAVGYAFVGSENPYAIWNFNGEEWSDSGSVANGITGEPGVGFSSIFTPQPYDGTMIIVLSNNDTITVDLNHNHDAYFSKVVGTAQPTGGFLPDVAYNLGTLTGTVTFALASAVSGNLNHYFWMFDTDSTAPTVTWPAGLTWADGSAPTVSASKHYEISILGGVAYYSEV